MNHLKIKKQNLISFYFLSFFTLFKQIYLFIYLCSHFIILCFCHFRFTMTLFFIYFSREKPFVFILFIVCLIETVAVRSAEGRTLALQRFHPGDCIGRWVSSQAFVQLCFVFFYYYYYFCTFYFSFTLFYFFYMLSFYAFSVSIHCFLFISLNSFSFFFFFFHQCFVLFIINPPVFFFFFQTK